MNRNDRKSKMVSFRLSPEEYRQFHDACSIHGVRNVSELARSAMQGLISTNGNAMPLHLQVEELRDRVSTLSEQIHRIAEKLEPVQQTTAAAGD